MSVLIDNSITIYEALEHIKDGKYVMPAFQRQYVSASLLSQDSIFIMVRKFSKTVCMEYGTD